MTIKTKAYMYYTCISIVNLRISTTYIRMSLKEDISLESHNYSTSRPRVKAVEISKIISGMFQKQE